MGTPFVNVLLVLVNSYTINISSNKLVGLTISTSGNRKAYEFIVGNVDGMTFPRSQRPIDKNIFQTFIIFSRDHLVQTIISHFSKIPCNTHKNQ